MLALTGFDIACILVLVTFNNLYLYFLCTLSPSMLQRSPAGDLADLTKDPEPEVHLGSVGDDAYVPV